MNLFRVFKDNQTSPEYARRKTLLEKLQGKASFSEEELKEIFKFNKIMAENKNPEAYDMTSQAFREPVLAEKIRALKRLHGVGIIMASTILAFQNPYKYVIMNPAAVSILQKHYGLPVVHKEKRGEYSTEDYARYLEKAAALAEEFGMKPFDIEFALGMIKD